MLHACYYTGSEEGRRGRRGEVGRVGREEGGRVGDVEVIPEV